MVFMFYGEMNAGVLRPGYSRAYARLALSLFYKFILPLVLGLNFLLPQPFLVRTKLRRL